MLYLAAIIAVRDYIGERFGHDHTTRLNCYSAAAEYLDKLEGNANQKSRCWENTLLVGDED